MWLMRPFVSVFEAGAVVRQLVGLNKEHETQFSVIF